MTSGPSPDLPNPWPVILAAYADGELDPPTREAVERWLAAHPAARRDLWEQQQLAPGNWHLWNPVDPPLPTEDAWAAVANAIAAAALPEPSTARRDAQPDRPGRAGRWFVVAMGATIGLAACILVAGQVFVSPPASAPVVVTQRVDPLSDFIVLPVAEDDDVDVHRVTGNGAGWLPVGVPPLPERMVLAEIGDVDLEATTPAATWPPDGPPITPRPGDAPMIFATNPR